MMSTELEVARRPAASRTTREPWLRRGARWRAGGSVVALSVGVLLALNVGCSSAEEQVGAAAVRYVELAMAGDDEGLWGIACPEDQAAMTVAELGDRRGDVEEATATRDEAAVHGVHVDSVALDEVRRRAEVAVGSREGAGTTTVVVRREGERWCVELGWARDKAFERLATGALDHVMLADLATRSRDFDAAEEGLKEAEETIARVPVEHAARRLVETELKDAVDRLEEARARARYDAVAAEVEDRLDRATEALSAWRLDEADEELTAAEERIAEIPIDRPERGPRARVLGEARALHAVQSEGWIAGRWSSSETRDPMTDEVNSIVSLMALDGVPNSIGRVTQASLIVRCERGRLEAFISAGTMLDYSWRSDTVRAQHRFDDEPATRLLGGASTSRNAMFLRTPRARITELMKRDGARWRVELPVYGRRPATVTFDLTGSSQAIPRALEACPR